MRRMLLMLLGPAIVAIGCGQSDAGITTSVKSQLAADDTVSASQIDVETRDRVVTLRGEVRSTAEESRALEIARNATGVSDVVDEISIAPAESAAPTTGAGDIGIDTRAGAAGVDAGITARVKADLIADERTSGLSIDVDTRDGVVTLTGNVKSSAEEARAIEIARKAEGVNRVEDELTVGADR